MKTLKKIRLHIFVQIFGKCAEVFEKMASGEIIWKDWIKKRQNTPEENGFFLNRQSESYICTCKHDFPGQYG